MTTERKKKHPKRLRVAVGRMIANHDLRMRATYHAELRRTVPTTKLGTVRLNGGPLVQPRTLAMLEQWQRAAVGHMASGELLDRLVAFAASAGFAVDQAPRVVSPAHLLPPP